MTSTVRVNAQKRSLAGLTLYTRTLPTGTPENCYYGQAFDDFYSISSCECVNCILLLPLQWLVHKIN